MVRAPQQGVRTQGLDTQAPRQKSHHQPQGPHPERLPCPCCGPCLSPLPHPAPGLLGPLEFPWVSFSTQASVAPEMGSDNLGCSPGPQMLPQQGAVVTLFFLCFSVHLIFFLNIESIHTYIFKVFFWISEVTLDTILVGKKERIPARSEPASLLPNLPGVSHTVFPGLSLSTYTEV